MTREVDGVLIIESESPQQCDLCGQIDELRPYGPNGEHICFECAKKNPVATNEAIYKRFSKVSTVLFNGKYYEMNDELKKRIEECREELKKQNDVLQNLMNKNDKTN